MLINVLTCGIVAIVAFGVGYLVASSPSGITPPVIPSNNSFSVDIPPWPVFRVAIAVSDALAATLRAVTPPSVQIRNLASGFWDSEILFAIVKSGIMDALGGKARVCSKVAEQLELNVDYTCRYMRAGVSLGLLQVSTTTDATTKVQVTKYRETATGALLRKNHPNGLHNWCLLFGHFTFQKAWSVAGEQSLVTGKTGMKESTGMEFFEYLQSPDNEEIAAIFDKAMVDSTRETAEFILSDWALPFPDATVCDIGGGEGTLLAAVASHYPNMKGLLFDLPNIAKKAKEHFAQHHLSDRIQTVGGDFFTSLPKVMEQCDVFFLKHILHDWSDSECDTILKNVKSVARKGSTIVGADFILGASTSSSMEVVKVKMDINMVVMTNGRERTWDEYIALFHRAGIKSPPTLIPTRELVSIVHLKL